MPFQIDVKHPLYLEFIESWGLMRDCFAGEDQVKASGETYLPMKSGMLAMADASKRLAAYNGYKLRAEFPELVAPTIRGSVGLIHDKPSTVELPSALEHMRRKATRDGLTLEGLHRRITFELMTVGRYGLLAGVDAAGSTYIAGYTAETIINWDATDGATDYIVLDESGLVRDRATNQWTPEKRFRECFVENGVPQSREWIEGGAAMVAGDPVRWEGRAQAKLDGLPFVFIDTIDLTADPDDVPLYGLAKLALRIYRLDADYTMSLHMTSEPTPYVAGNFDREDPNRKPPTTIGASALWVLPEGARAEFLEFTGPGLASQEKAIGDALQRAVMFGAQVLTDTSRAAESGHALRLRLGNQYSIIKSIAMNAAAGLERALRHAAVIAGADPEKVKVVPDLDFIDRTLTAQDIGGLVAGWQAGAYSKRTLFENLQRGEIIPAVRTFEDEEEMIADDPLPEPAPDPNRPPRNRPGEEDE